MRELFQRIHERFVDHLAALRHGPKYAIKHVVEIPDRLASCTIYLLGAPEPWSAALLCPCGCPEIIHISLLQKDSPSWCLHINARNEPTLEPSIWRRHGCKSHLFIRNGRIFWYKRI
jgi:uncharacterized protein DUF6527